MRDRNYLFHGRDLRSFLEERSQAISQEIDSINADRLLNTPTDDLCKYFVDKYSLEPLTVRFDDTQVDQQEAQVDVSGDHRRHIWDRSKPFYIAGTNVQFFVPYEGDEVLFQLKPSSWTTVLPSAVARNGELIFAFQQTDHDHEQLNREFNSQIGTMNIYLDSSRKDVLAFNATIQNTCQQRIEWRKDKLLKDRGMVANLGFPMRKRPDAPTTYVAPSVKRKVVPQLPPASSVPYTPEPTLAMEEYEHILSVVDYMSEVMERAPQAVIGLDEESLRTHFLVQLNGQYQGQASAETFNFDGKTDILIRTNGKTIFIAECKFWKGQEVLTETVDQLLRYTSWRDTKTSIIIFNRNKNFSAVLDKIPETVRKHPNYKKDLPYSSDHGFRFVLSHRDDPSRELILTVLAFEVPQ